MVIYELSAAIMISQSDVVHCDFGGNNEDVPHPTGSNWQSLWKYGHLQNHGLEELMQNGIFLFVTSLI